MSSKAYLEATERSAAEASAALTSCNAALANAISSKQSVITSAQRAILFFQQTQRTEAGEPGKKSTNLQPPSSSRQVHQPLPSASPKRTLIDNTQNKTAVAPCFEGSSSFRERSARRAAAALAAAESTEVTQEANTEDGEGNIDRLQRSNEFGGRGPFTGSISGLNSGSLTLLAEFMLFGEHPLRNETQTTADDAISSSGPYLVSGSENSSTRTSTSSTSTISSPSSPSSSSGVGGGGRNSNKGVTAISSWGDRIVADLSQLQFPSRYSFEQVLFFDLQ